MIGNALELSDVDFGKLSEFIYNHYGIKLPLAKKIMLQARLQSRLKATGIKSFKEYCNYIFSKSGQEQEIPFMIDVVSTNKTDFFRENNHFQFLLNRILPDFREKDYQTISVWSSASSSGEEPYTIAMLLEEWVEQNRGVNYQILGTDISTRMLEKARSGIYANDKLDPIPLTFRKKYLLKHKNPENEIFRINKSLRDKIVFKRLNLMDDVYKDIPHDFNVIFCRNVLIYFDKPTQEKVINKLCSHLKSDGYFFLGHSESITGLDVPLKQIAPTTYIKN